MKKRLASLLLAVATITTICVPSIAVELDNKELEFREELQELIDNNIRAGDPAIIEGFESFTQNDYDSNFTDYADMDATMMLPIPISENTEVSNVVGTVFCQETNEPIANAVVTVKNAADNGEITSVTTDTAGRFQILGLAGGFYNWTLENNDYYTAEYSGYDVCEGITTMFTFYMSNQETIDKKSFHSSEAALSENIFIVEEAEEISEVEPKTFSFSRVPTLSSFTVGIGANSYGNGGTARTVGRSTYLTHVVPNEALGAWICKNTYDMTDAQIKQYYAAQTVAACSFIEWAVHGDPKHSGYTVCDTSNCQRYDPTSTNTYAVEALGLVSDSIDGDVYYTIMLYKPTSRTYDYVYPAYFLHCNGKTVTHPTRPELQEVSCSDIDGTHSSCLGNGWGMCQMGAAKMAKNEYNYVNILQHYYTNTTVVIAFQ